MLSLSDNNQADVVEEFNSTSIYLNDFLNIYNPYFDQMVSQINPTELQLNKTDSLRCSSPPSHSVYISQLILYVRLCSNVDDFNNRNKLIKISLLIH